MSKLNIIYECSKCGSQSPKWTGRCFECGEWGALEERERKTQNEKRKTMEESLKFFTGAKVQNLGTLEAKNIPRIKTGISELDKVLGGGIVPGSLILLGGEPGIGKSTLLLQVAATINSDSKNANARELREEMNERDSKNANARELREDKIVEKELSYRLTGIFFDVQKELGRFCRERQYGDVLEQKLTKAQINFKREMPIEIADRKSNFADFIVEDKILIELKTKPYIEKDDYYQILRYIENKNLHLGLLVNFRQEHLKPKRVVNSKFQFFERGNSSNFESFECNSSHSSRVLSDFESFECNSSHSSRNILYASGEESAEQLKSRFDRLKLDARNIQYLGETRVESICGTIMQIKPALAIVDSIQMVSSDESESAPGSMSQIKVATTMLATAARETQIPIIVVGHVTKDGGLAGPKTLEHLVDVVLEFSGDRGSDLRILRAIKNRFGATGEMAFFEMTSSGLTEVPEPSKLLLTGKIDAPGSVVGIVLEGSRPLAVEFQSLLNRTNFGYPKRQAVGFDLNKLQLLAAVIAKRTNINMNYFDAHLKIVGGVRVTEPGADLAVTASIISAIQNKTLPQDTVIIGEVGLTGEVRPVPQMEKRLEEAAKLGFKNAIVPNAVLKTTKLKLLKIKNVGEILNLL